MGGPAGPPRGRPLPAGGRQRVRAVPSLSLARAGGRRAAGGGARRAGVARSVRALVARAARPARAHPASPHARAQGGGHAFIGYHLAKQLAAKGHDVTIFNDGDEARARARACAGARRPQRGKRLARGRRPERVRARTRARGRPRTGAAPSRTPQAKLTAKAPFNQYASLSGVKVKFGSPTDYTTFPEGPFDVVYDNNGKDLESCKPLIDASKARALRARRRTQTTARTCGVRLAACGLQREHAAAGWA